MGKPINHVTIVGGGTAGWMTALLLQSLCQNDKRRKDALKVTLIESPNIPTVGVGEATVPGMPRTLRTAGVSEKEFMKRCNASFKLGVLFDKWNVGNDGKPIGYVNPFARPPAVGGVDAGWYFAEHGAGELDFTQVFSPCVDLARACKGPRPLGVGEFDQSVGFAYHLDAGKFSGMLRDICIERGVEHILDDMVSVEQDERGYISGVILKERGLHEIEFVIDCTGFRGLIINEALGEPFVSYSDVLANDRALAVQIPHPEPDRLEPMTRSTALGAGWTWRVPLYSRIGTGYVFSSAHRSDDDAREEFLASLGPAGKDAEPRVIPMRVGRTRTAWVKNCVAIGLSGGFIEPLESTAIHMIDTGVRWLVSYFPDLDFAEPLRDRYNKLVTQLYDEVRDFICLHYALGNRTDSQYWIDVREELKVPDSLAANLELWKHKLPAAYDIDFVSLFSPWTYQAVLLGKRVYETGYGDGQLQAAVTTDVSRWRDYLAKSRARTRQIVEATADHRTLLKELRGELDPEILQAPAWLAAKKPAPMGQPNGPQATVQLPGLGAPLSAKLRRARKDAQDSPAEPQDKSEDISLL